MAMIKKIIIKKIGHSNIDIEINHSLKKKILPLKFCYLNKGANAWDTLRNNKNSNFELGNKEISSFKKLLSKIPELKTPTNIVHFGVGNGLEIPELFSSFDFKKHSYIGVDISLSLIKKSVLYQEKISSINNRIFLSVSTFISSNAV